MGPLPSGFKTKEEYAAYMRKYRKRKSEQQAKMMMQAQAYNELVNFTEREVGKIVERTQDMMGRLAEATESGEILDVLVMTGYGYYFGAITWLMMIEHWGIERVFRQALAIIQLLIQQAPKDRATQFMDSYHATKYVHKKLLANPQLPEETRNSILESQKVLETFYEATSKALKEAQKETSFTLKDWVV